MMIEKRLPISGKFLVPLQADHIILPFGASGAALSRPRDISAALSGSRDIGPAGASGPIISSPDPGAITPHSLSHSPTQTPNKDLPTLRDTETGMDCPHNTTNNNKSRLKPRALTKN